MAALLILVLHRTLNTIHRPLVIRIIWPEKVPQNIAAKYIYIYQYKLLYSQSFPTFGKRAGKSRQLFYI